MATWQNSGPGYPSQQGYPYPPNPGYPPPPEGYPGQNPYSNPPPPGFVPPQGIPPYSQVPPPHVPPQQPGMYGSSYAEDPLQDGPKGFEFSDKSIRNGFIRKVYSILMLQLAFTMSMIALFLYHEPTQRWTMNHPALFYVCLIATFVLLVCMACCTSVRRKAPMNFIFLGLFTFAESFVLATASSTFHKEEVFLAVAITTAVCLGLTVFAFQTKYDFTGCGTILFVIILVFMIFGLFAIFFHSKIMTLVYASIGALIFSIYLVYDTQMMVGGSHKYSISPEEYIFAALNLYMDIINIFLYILTIIGASRD